MITDEQVEAARKAFELTLQMQFQSANFEQYDFDAAWLAALIAAERAAWHEGMDDAPKDLWIVVETDAAHGLPSFVTVCHWLPDAGVCVDELRQPVRWRELPEGLTHD